MSTPKFAAITSDLLARKGEARPWNEPAKQPLAWRADVGTERVERMERVERPKDEQPDYCVPKPQNSAWKKCSVRISAHNFERLGIFAVKQGTTRHHLLEDVIEQFFDNLTRQYGNSCPCLGAADGMACKSKTG